MITGAMGGELKVNDDLLGKIVRWSFDVKEPPVDITPIGETKFKEFLLSGWRVTVTGLCPSTIARDWLLEGIRSSGVSAFCSRRWWQCIVPVEFYYEVTDVMVAPAGGNKLVVSGTTMHEDPQWRLVMPGRRLIAASWRALRQRWCRHLH